MSRKIILISLCGALLLGQVLAHREAVEEDEGIQIQTPESPIPSEDTEYLEIPHQEETGPKDFNYCKTYHQ